MTKLFTKQEIVNNFFISECEKEEAFHLKLQF